MEMPRLVLLRGGMVMVKVWEWMCGLCLFLFLLLGGGVAVLIVDVVVVVDFVVETAFFFRDTTSSCVSVIWDTTFFLEARDDALPRPLDGALVVSLIDFIAIGMV